jgi:hypothetical protein
MGIQTIDGSEWLSYQKERFRSPHFPNLPRVTARSARLVQKYYVRTLGAKRSAIL